MLENTAKDISSNTLIGFYMYRKPNTKGLTLDQIVGESDGFWEYDHDYFNWVFPTDQVCNKTGEIMLTEEILNELDKSLDVYDTMMVVFQRFLRFLGLVYRKQITHLGTAKYMWQYPNRNFMKIGQCIESLRLIGHPLAIEQFLEFLQEEKARRPFVISEKTYDYWVAQSGLASELAEL